MGQDLLSASELDDLESLIPLASEAKLARIRELLTPPSSPHCPHQPMPRQQAFLEFGHLEALYSGLDGGQGQAPALPDRSGRGPRGAHLLTRASALARHAGGRAIRLAGAAERASRSDRHVELCGQGAGRGDQRERGVERGVLRNAGAGVCVSVRLAARRCNKWSVAGHYIAETFQKKTPSTEAAKRHVERTTG
jgi:hypothetical protein